MVKLSDGKEYTADLTIISVGEYRALFNRDQPIEEEDKTIAKAYGFDPSKIAAMPLPDYRKLMDDFFAAARNPENLK